MEDLNSLFSFKIINECKLCKSSLIENDESMKKAINMSLNLPLSGISTCGVCAKKYLHMKKLNNTFKREINS